MRALYVAIGESEQTVRAHSALPKTSLVVGGDAYALFNVLSCEDFLLKLHNRPMAVALLLVV